MKTLARLVLVVCVVSMATSLAEAQERQGGRGRGGFGGGFGGGGLVGLLNQKSVQDELKLTDDQIAKATKLSEDQRGSFRDLQNLSQEERRAKFRERAEATNKAIAEIVNADQLKRLKEINLQQRGTEALNDEEVATALNLTSEQKDKLRAVREEAREEMRKAFENREGNREEAQKKLAELRTSTQEKTLAVLTDAQKATWKSLQGEPFKGELRRGGGNRPRRAGGNTN